jgi:hypothetical protein
MADAHCMNDAHRMNLWCPDLLDGSDQYNRNSDRWLLMMDRAPHFMDLSALGAKPPRTLGKTFRQCPHHPGTWNDGRWKSRAKSGKT